MKTRIKISVLTLAAFCLFAVQASAQTVSAAIVDQHYATQEWTYKTIMVLLAVIYAAYLVVRYRHKKQVSRYLGKF